MGMNEQERNPSLLRSQMEQIANDLSDLFLTITTISCGLEAEAIEPQVIANLNTIARCVAFIQKFAFSALDSDDGDEKNRHE